MTVDVSLVHTFVGCNRVVGALDWGENGLIAFAAHNAVALYDVGRQRILGTLLGQGDRVNCVRWLDTMTLVSGSADGSLCLYRRSTGSGTAISNWTLVARSTPPSPGAPITFIAGTKWAMAMANETADVNVLIVTSGDGSVGVWTVDWNAAQTVLLQRVDQLMLETAALPTCAAIMRPSPTAARDLPCLLVAVGCVDGEVRLYTCHPPFSLKLACRLPGHSNWVRGVAFTSTRSSDNSLESILLASASQDRTVRLWRLVDCEDRSSTHDAACNVLTRFAPKPHFTINGIIKYEAHVEALLLGHEDWVLSVSWQPRQRLSEHTATLLTTSMDRTMMLWVRDEKTGLWLPRESVGDAGVNHLGYYTGVWSHDGLSLATHGYTGALHIWERDPKALAPRPASTGHYGAVVDITWSPDGQFLLTASTDQTVRVIGQLESRNGESGESEWTELGRPQVHGHDLSCIAAMYPRPDHSSPLNMINEDKSVGRSNRNLCGYKYASGGEEKVIRVFQSPTAFLETLDMARGLVVGVKDRSRNEAYSTFTAYGATLPALGLSNKAFRFDEHAGENGQRHPRDGVPGIGADQYDVGPDFAPTCAPSSVGGRPLEEHLSQNTLWPEIHKLYGHGNELFCLAADPKGKYLASACKSQSTATAAILLWDTATWTVVSSGIKAHTLTVTQVAFSPDGKFLASASRDRSFAVSERVEDETEPFRLVSTVTKAHGRIIWGISWSPDASMVLTASRDGFLGVWRVSSNGTVQQPAATMIGFEKQSVCCVDTCELPGDEKTSGCLVAVGLESGMVVVGTVTSDDSDVHWREVWRSNEASKHTGAVRKVAWRPQRNNGASGSLYDNTTVLATCGDDHAVRLFHVCLH